MDFVDDHRFCQRRIILGAECHARKQHQVVVAGAVGPTSVGNAGQSRIKLDVVGEANQLIAGIRLEQVDVVAPPAAEGEVVRTGAAGRVEIALVEHEVLPRGEFRPVGDAELPVVAGRVAQIPTADGDRAGGRIVQLDRVGLSKVGLRKHFVNDDVGRRFGAGCSRTAPVGCAGPPVVVVAVIAGRIAQFESAALAVRPAGPAAFIIEIEVVDYLVEPVRKRELLSGVVERSGVLARDAVHGSVSQHERRGVFHDHDAFARFEVIDAAIIEVEIDSIGETQVAQIDPVAARIDQFDEFEVDIGQQGICR